MEKIYYESLNEAIERNCSVAPTRLSPNHCFSDTCWSLLKSLWHHEFKKLINNKKFLEYAKVFKNYYGSIKETVINKIKKGENVIFDRDKWLENSL